MALTPTPEQEAILQAASASASLMISAFAGTAKTTTLEMLAPKLAAPSILALAFNVKIKDELEKRLPKHFTVKTMNGLGHGAWGKATGKRLTLDTSKLGKAITQEAKAQSLDLGKDQWNDVRLLVSAARGAGLVPDRFPHKGLLPDTQQSWEDLADDQDINANSKVLAFAKSVLTRCIQEAFSGTIDFDDQIYMSVLFNGVFPTFHTVLVDEAQDLSLMNHLMLKKCRPQRLVVCGDPNQSLYAFRGAATDSMGKIRALLPDWIDLPLTLTFRCPQVVVARQQWHVPGYRAAQTNAKGQFLDWVTERPSKEGWGWTNVPSGGTCAVACRNNAPLVKLAFKLLRKNIPCHMLGRDLGRGLQATLKDLKLDASTPINTVAQALSAWHSHKEALLKANNKERDLEKLSDRYESLCAVMEASGAETLAALVSAINDLFSRDRGLVTLSTGHRIKGLEFDTVLHLDPWRVPSKFAKSEEAQRQEANVSYVIETRAKHTLINANLEDFS